MANWKEALVFALVFFAAMFLLKLSIGETDIWGPYYYRHAEKTYALGTTFYYDDLSYLGRDFTYPPAYFMFSAQAAGLVQAPDGDSIRVPLHLLVMFFSLFTTYLLFENLGKRTRLIASLMLILYTFYFITNLSITLHALSFALLNCAVIFFRRKEAEALPLGTASLSLAFSVHPLSLLAFPVYAYVVSGFTLNIRRLFVFGMGAVILSLPLYLPIFLKSGLPSEIVPTQWGYVHSYGFDGMYADMLFLLPLALLAFAFGLARGDKLNPLILLALFLATAYVSFRANLFLAVFLAGYFPHVFKNELADNRFYSLCILALMANLALTPVIYSGVTDWCSWGAMNRMCAAPMQYISTFTPSQSRIAMDPELAHLEAYLGKRPVLSDLYVEYADEKKYVAEAIFYYEMNTTPLEPYGIELLFLSDRGGRVKELNDTDRVYDNGYVHLFRRPFKQPA